MLPVVRELEAEYSDRITFQIIDYYADQTKPLLSQYRVRGHPSFVLLGRDGTPTSPVQGIVARERLVEMIEAALA
ncbi:MAG: thioredoxin domain-containing protein [Chloroflexota bacterium]